MYSYVKSILQKIEDLIPKDASRDLVFEKLRQLSLSDFGEFMITIPNPEFPRLSHCLPRMASNEVQTAWTGSSGITLLTQTTDFVRSMSYNFAKISGRTLEGKKILDYGCGYGRISRIMYYFTDESNLFALDPWDESIDLCHSHGLEKNFALSEYLPKSLPLEDKVDLIFAFSVFTHLSQRATTTNLNTLSNYLKPGGLIVITVRPVEYWDIDKYANERGLVNHLKSKHSNNGFAFLPHNRTPVDGDITYGDTSMSLRWIEDNFNNLEIVGIDRSLTDTYQIYIFLRIRKGSLK